MKRDRRFTSTSSNESGALLAELPEFKALKERLEAPPPEKEVIEPKPNTSRKPFTGRVASGRGRLITSDDSSYAIEANPPLNAREQGIAVKNGFDDESPAQDASLFIADKKTMREADGDINYVAMVTTNEDKGRGR